MESYMALEVGGGLQAVVPLAADPPLSCTVAMQDVHLGTRRLKVRTCAGCDSGATSASDWGAVSRKVLNFWR